MIRGGEMAGLDSYLMSIVILAKEKNLETWWISGQHAWGLHSSCFLAQETSPSQFFSQFRSENEYQQIIDRRNLINCLGLPAVDLHPCQREQPCSW